MPRKRKALTFAKHNVIEVFISREYLEELGIMDKVAYAMETENYSKVYEALITDAKNSDDFN
ncbi:MAG: hypothetical protein GY697_12720, partial [Desulfobacterales bacterium]|nr:hypothetical protein [Desulfobacterales bacterium]